MDAREYWKQCVIDYLDCCEDDYKNVDIDKVAESLLNDDHLWCDIDFHIQKNLNNARG